jgi:hypothetical protein
METLATHHLKGNWPVNDVENRRHAAALILRLGLAKILVETGIARAEHLQEMFDEAAARLHDSGSIMIAMYDNARLTLAQ